MKEIQWAGADTIHFEVTKKLSIFRGFPPVTFAYVDSYTDFSLHHPLHIHQDVEIYFCISDKVDYIVNGDFYRLRPGDIVVLHACEPHRVVLREPHQYERFFVSFPMGAFPKHLHDPLLDLLDALEGKPNRLRPTTEEDGVIRGLLYDTLALCRGDIAEGQIGLHQTKIYAKLLELLCALRECAHRTCPPNGRAPDEHLPEPLADVMLYIDQNYRSVETVNEIADAVHVSPSYLSALFRKHLGVPLVYHLQSRKMSHAKQLLEEGYSVNDACLAAGYTDCSYFIRVFKRHLGMTPLKYRAAFCAGKEESAKQ